MITCYYQQEHDTFYLTIDTLLSISSQITYLFVLFLKNRLNTWQQRFLETSLGSNISSLHLDIC